MDRSHRIHAALTAAFSPEQLDVADESAMHAGHAGASPAGETHYRVTICASHFAGMSRVQMQREINKVLQPEFDRGLHALALKATAPQSSSNKVD